MTFKLVSPAFLDVVEEFLSNSRTLNVFSCLLSALSTFLGGATFSPWLSSAGDSDKIGLG